MHNKRNRVLSYIDVNKSDVYKCMRVEYVRVCALYLFSLHVCLCVFFKLYICFVCVSRFVCVFLCVLVRVLSQSRIQMLLCLKAANKKIRWVLSLHAHAHTHILRHIHISHIHMKFTGQYMRIFHNMQEAATVA